MKAVYPGSFDPLSNGHLDIIRRAAKMFDELHILVSYNMFKKSTFTPEERVEMIKLVTKDLKNVYVEESQDLVVNYCAKNDVGCIIRGLRNYQDYENEFSLFQYNHDINPNVETMLLFPSSKNQFISSSAIKELVSFGVDIKNYVPSELVETITNRFKGLKWKIYY